MNEELSTRESFFFLFRGQASFFSFSKIHLNNDSFLFIEIIIILKKNNSIKPMEANNAEEDVPEEVIAEEHDRAL